MESLNFDDSKWINADTPWGIVCPKDIWEPFPIGPALVSQQIPASEHVPQRIKLVRKAENVTIPGGFPAKKSTIVFKPNTTAKILLDQTHLTNAYPVVEFNGGKDAKVTIKYAESLYIPTTVPGLVPKEKGHRDDIEGKQFVGAYDQFTADGKKHTFESLWWRTWRYVELTVTTAEEPLVIEDLYGIFTAYPFELKSDFQTDVKEIKPILDVGWRTARLCANETYFDCPYYEQLQYVGDTRIQALISVYNSGDTRLMKNAIRQIKNSLSGDGITQARYPSNLEMFIPTFCLIWVAMVHDYYIHTRDITLIKETIPVIRSIMFYFIRFTNQDGSLKKVPHWNFVDWTGEEIWPGGMPPRDENGNSATLDLLYLISLQNAVEIEKNVGEDYYYYQKLKLQEEKLSLAVVAKYWNPKTKMFSEKPGEEIYSQHANALAVIAKIVKGEEAKQLMAKTLKEKNIIPCSIYFKYYLHEAVNKAGLGDIYLDLLEDWNVQLSRGVTTWAETAATDTRSDCHAWGASPNILMYKIILGIESDAPGFKKVRIAPNLGKLKKASGKIPHPDGEIVVDYAIDKKGKLAAKVHLPPGVTGVFVWKGQERILISGEQVFVL